MHVRSCRKSFPTDKKITGSGKSVDLRYYLCTYFGKDIDHQVIFLLGCFGELRLWKCVIPLKDRSIFNQRNSNLKIKIRGAALPENSQAQSCSVVDCCRRLPSLLTLFVQSNYSLYHILFWWTCYNRFLSWLAVMCEIHGPRASGRHKTLWLRRRVLWCPEFLVPCISHITASHD